MTVMEFLLARISDDEEKASAAEALASIYAPKKVRWHWLRTDGNSSAWEPTNHTPARVLAECEAKRAIIDDAAQMGVMRGAWALKRLAAVYADHPDYRAEWAL